MSKWEKVKLGDIGDFKSGGTPTRSKPEYFEGEIPWITTTSLGKTFIDENDATTHISQEAVFNSATKLISKNSIMIGTRVGVGKVSINTVPMCTSQDIISIENIDEECFYKPYILHSIKSYNRYFDTQKRGATIQGINSGVLKSIDIPKPPLGTQKQIAKTLDTTSELLAMRKQQLAELDNLIKSTFYDMFGDPVTNEKGWVINQINDACSEIVDCPHSTPSHSAVPTDYPAIRTSEIQNGSINWRSMKYVSEQEYLKRIKRIVPQEADIIYAREGSYGDAVILPSGYTFCLGQRVMLLRADKEICHHIYLWYVIRSEYVYNQARLKNVGATVGHVNVGDIKRFNIPLPPLELQTQFANIVTKIEEQKALVKKAIDETQHLFDSLMSEYFE